MNSIENQTIGIKSFRLFVVRMSPKLSNGSSLKNVSQCNIWKKCLKLPSKKGLRLFFLKQLKCNKSGIMWKGVLERHFFILFVLFAVLNEWSEWQY